MERGNLLGAGYVSTRSHSLWLREDKKKSLGILQFISNIPRSSLPSVNLWFEHHPKSIKY